MKLLALIAQNRHSLAWKFSLFPAFVGIILSAVFLFYPSTEMCENYRLLSMSPSDYETSLMLCEYRYWFAGGSFFLAWAWAGAMNLIAFVLTTNAK